MKNRENWDEGNRYSTILLIRSGTLLVILACFGHFLIENETAGWLAAVILDIVSTACLIFFTERHLKKKFG